MDLKAATNKELLAIAATLKAEMSARLHNLAGPAVDTLRKAGLKPILQVSNKGTSCDIDIEHDGANLPIKYMIGLDDKKYKIRVYQYNNIVYLGYDLNEAIDWCMNYTQKYETMAEQFRANGYGCTVKHENGYTFITIDSINGINRTSSDEIKVMYSEGKLNIILTTSDSMLTDKVLAWLVNPSDDYTIIPKCITISDLARIQMGNIIYNVTDPQAQVYMIGTMGRCYPALQFAYAADEDHILVLKPAGGTKAKVVSKLPVTPELRTAIMAAGKKWSKK